MTEPSLRLVIQTPRERIFEGKIKSLRLPTQTGQVGIRPRIEPLVLAVEPGLILISSADLPTFVGTAGGLFRCDGEQASLATPLAIRGESMEAVVQQIETALERPSVEFEVRDTLGRLESNILNELREGAQRNLTRRGINR